jgi:uncharacterized coiled-coil protein SlyX
MAITEQRIEELEVMILDLNEQVRRNHVILNGDPNVAFSSGVLWRLEKIENKFMQQSDLIKNLAFELKQQNEQREKEHDIRQAREQERTEIFQRMEKWVKILGPLLGGGLGFQIIFEIIKSLNGG